MTPRNPNRDRAAAMAAALDAAFGADAGSPWGAAPVEVVRAPSSVNLMGGHTEYNDGYVLTAAIDLDTWIGYRRRRDGLVRVASRHSRDVGSFWIDSLAPAAASVPTDRWADYVAAAAWSMREAALPIRGFDGVVDSTIPPGSGLAESAALELASAMALLGEVQSPAAPSAANPALLAPSLAALAQRGERDYLGANSGIVDQFACAAGRDGRALLLDCRSLDVRYVALPYGIRLVVCDTGATPNAAVPVLDTRRGECARAVALLSEQIPGLCSLRDLDPASLRRHRALLPENVARRAEHVVSENARAVAAAAALESGDLDRLGRLFAESHASLRDLYEVSSPALDTMVDVALTIPGVVAARMTGDGVGSCTVNLVLADAVPALQAAVSREYDRRSGLHGRVYPVAVVAGAGPLPRP